MSGNITSPMTGEPELLGCPFCGGTSEAEEHFPTLEGQEVAVRCLDCGAAVYGDDKDEAIARWNNRPTLSQPVGERALRDREREIVQDLREIECGRLGQDAANLIEKLHRELQAALTTPAPVGEEAVERAAVLWARNDIIVALGPGKDEFAQQYREGLHDRGMGIKARVRAFQAGTALASISSANGLREALIKCRDKFFEYERLHAAKGTLDGDVKARANYEMAEMCEAALNSPPAGLGKESDNGTGR